MYRKLTRKRRTPGGSSQLWLAGDHILLVNSSWWVQNYRRFRLSEIQALVAVERPSWRPVQAVVLVITLLLLALSLWGAVSITGKIFGAIVFGSTLAAEIADLARGPYCRLTLHTAVSDIRIPAITRMRAAERFLAAIVPSIESSQAALAPAIAQSLPHSEPEPAPPMPGSTASRVPNYVFFGAVLFVALASLVPLVWTIPFNTTSGLWSIAFLSVLLGVYIVITTRGATILRILCLLCVTGAAAGILVKLFAVGQNLIALKSPPDQRAIEEQLTRFPAWFIRYSWFENPIQAFAGLLGILLTWLKGRRT
jgi:hypothetical protein